MFLNNRIEWIDIAKGIGIWLVIAGHCISLRYSYPIYSFHMPLFFFLSGLFFGGNKYDSWNKLLRDKSRSILKPFITIWIISLLISMLIPKWRTELSIKNIFIDFYTANQITIHNSSLWFLICLFIVFVLAYAVYRITNNKISKLWLCILLVIFALGSCYTTKILKLFSISIVHIPFNNRLPFKLDTAFVALVFFLVGTYLKKSIYNFVCKRHTLTEIATLFVLLSVGSIYNGWVNLNSFDFGKSIILFYFVAFCGIVLILLFSQYLVQKKLIYIVKIFVFYGKNSLLIFGFQSLFLRLYLLLFNSENSKLILYGDNPLIHQIGSFFIITFILSPLLVVLNNYIKKHINII